MAEHTWPYRSDGPPFTSLPLINQNPYPIKRPISNYAKNSGNGFAAIPYDLLRKIAAAFKHEDIRNASLVCVAWRDGLRTLREAMLFLRWGKRFKHGRSGVKKNPEKALESFLKGAARGSTLAMMDAGLMYWEMGMRKKGIEFYRKAAELGDISAQCNLGISYLHDEVLNPKEAIKWLYQASRKGHIRAQYQLALCFHQGEVVEQNLPQAARWYLRAADGGYVRAMYNISLCYSYGEGLVQSHRQARRWMKRAADRGHSRAQLDFGIKLFSEGEMTNAVVYLELANRAGEQAASHVKNAVVQQLSPTSLDRAMSLVNNWRPLPSYH